MCQILKAQKMYEINPETIRILSIALHELCDTQFEGPEAVNHLATLIRKHTPVIATVPSDKTEKIEVDDEIVKVNPRVVLVLGGPGSGKGTLCDSLVGGLGFRHISVGELLRAEVASGSDLGKEVEAIMQSGGLVSDELALRIVRSSLDSRPYAGTAVNVLLDGFPRTMDQAKLFEEDVCPVSKIIWLTCEDEAVLIERILSRGRLSGRADDNAESVAERLKTFKENTAPILEFYQGRNDGKLALLDASLSPDEVFNNVKLVLDHF